MFSASAEAPTLPQELIHAVIGCVAASKDHPSLRQCALSHRCMLQESQRHLFAEIVLELPLWPSPLDSRAGGSTVAQRLFEVLQRSTHLAAYIRGLNIVEHSHRRPASRRPLCYGFAGESVLSKIMPMLCNLVTLTLVCAGGSRIPDAFVDSLTLPSLQRLSIYGAKISPHVLNVLPSLRELRCSNVAWVASDSFTSRAPTRLMTGLQRLELCGVHLDTCEDVVELNIPYALLNALLRHCKDTLQYLHFYGLVNYLDPLNADLSILPALRELNIVFMDPNHTHIYDAQWSFVFQWLKSVHPLRRLALQLCFDPTSDTLTRDAKEWKILDDLLGSSHKKFAQVDFYNDDFEEPVIERALPRARESLGSNLRLCVRKEPINFFPVYR
ncbi:hypothetical protein BD626DRAFT_222280 [Schizophyllum amplum]|uniref:F-box domain-containing protein n=1 Tax=Schizophyllum amplum TaxID=97359 RepID=A0A550BXI2_9AGAR|nr:hypothetical protein BD626DRAFT_222280 [Auriculariopsis ampla]